MVKYKVIEQPSDQVEDTVIEKSGGVVKFSIKQVNENIHYINQKLRELEATRRVAEATKTNVLGTNPNVGELSAEDLTAAYLFRQAVGTATECESKTKELEEALEEETTALKEIAEQTGLVIE